jgi:hypothetical protein
MMNDSVGNRVDVPIAVLGGAPKLAMQPSSPFTSDCFIPAMNWFFLPVVPGSKFSHIQIWLSALKIRDFPTRKKSSVVPESAALPYCGFFEQVS